MFAKAPLLLLQACLVLTAAPPALFSNHFVVRVLGGRQEALRLADHLGLRLLPTELEADHFHLVEARRPSRSLSRDSVRTRALAAHPNVAWVQQQELKFRTLRNILQVFPGPPRGNSLLRGRHRGRNKTVVPSPLASPNTVKPAGKKGKGGGGNSLLNEVFTPTFDDPFYPLQWYLHGRGPVGTSRLRHLNVEGAWSQGVSGRGVTLFVLDDGVQAANRELRENYESWGSVDLSDMNLPLPGPAPRNANDSHGTYCAAIMAGVGNNAFCGVGIAYEAKVGGVKLLGSGPLSDLQESLALSLWLRVADVASASWGPKDDGATVDGPGPLALAALRKGVKMGREGRGAIYVWAVGNGGLKKDNCNLDGYASSIYTLTVSALTHKGKSCGYSEPCASILASTFVGGPEGPLGNSVVVPELDGSCRKNFQGTSAAAPLAAGIVALLLQANPKLTWREVQHLVATTARPQGTKGWRRNAAGLRFHLRKGFGAIDAAALVKAGRTFSNLPAQISINFRMIGGMRILYPRGNTTISLHLPASKLPLDKLEHVEVTVTLNHFRRRQLEMFIISPSGTESQVLTQRPLDKSYHGFQDWSFMSVHFWLEDPAGQWSFVVANRSKEPGILRLVHITLHGYRSEGKGTAEQEMT